MGTALKLYDQPVRAERGRWAKGHTGNVQGKNGSGLMREEREARRLIREGTIKAARKLLELIDSEDEKMAYAAACAVLDRSELKHAPIDEPQPEVFSLDDQEKACETELSRIRAEKQTARD